MNLKTVLATGTIVVLSSTTTLALSKFFTDVDTNSWYGTSVEKLADLGIIKGYHDGTFKPDQKVSRAELAVMLDRVIQYVETGKIVNTDTIPDETTYVQSLMGNIYGQGHELVLYSADAKINEGESCSKGYYAGNFKLALTYNNKFVHSINLGMIEVPAKDNIEDLGAGAGIKIIVFGDLYGVANGIYAIEKYGSCNNNTFAFYMTDNISKNGPSGEIKPVAFYGSDSNEISANSITPTENGFKLSAYDNSGQGLIEKTYNWDSGEKRFQEVN